MAWGARVGVVGASAAAAGRFVFSCRAWGSGVTELEENRASGCGSSARPDAP